MYDLEWVPEARDDLAGLDKPATLDRKPNLSLPAIGAAKWRAASAFHNFSSFAWKIA